MSTIAEATLFSRTLTKLVRSLNKKYGRKIPSIRIQHDRLAHLTTEGWCQLAEEWQRTMAPIEQSLTEEDASIFAAESKEALPIVLAQISLDQVWCSANYSENSKRYTWQYLRQLVASCQDHLDFHENGDIDPPSGSPLNQQSMNGLMSIAAGLPAPVLDKISKMACEFKAEVDDGTKSADDVDFVEITRKLANTLTGEDMQGMLENFSSLFAGVGSNDGAPDFSAFTSHLSKNIAKHEAQKVHSE